MRKLFCRLFVCPRRGHREDVLAYSPWDVATYTIPSIPYRGSTRVRWVGVLCSRCGATVSTRIESQIRS